MKATRWKRCGLSSTLHTFLDLPRGTIKRKTYIRGMSRIPKPFQGDMYFNGLYTVVKKSWLRTLLEGAEGGTRDAAEEAMAFAGGKGSTVNLDRVLEYICNSMSRGERTNVKAALFGPDEDLPRLAIDSKNKFASNIARKRLRGDMGGPVGSTGEPVGAALSSGRTVIREDDSRVYVSTRRKAK